MKKVCKTVFLLPTLILGISTASADSIVNPGQSAALLPVKQSIPTVGLPDFTGLVKAVSPAVVNISTTQKVKRKSRMDLRDFRQFIPEDLPEGMPDIFRDFLDKIPRSGPEQQQEGPSRSEPSSLGSGFIISEDGYIITNHHVVDGADEILVRLNDRNELPAKVIGSDQKSDIALLKIEADDLPTVKLASNEPDVGEWVLAIGSPFGFESSVTAGIVSAKGRVLGSQQYVPLLQTDVAINPGNSGGPLFNLRGEVVGVNSMIYSRSGGYMGLSFSIPVELAISVVEQLRTKGHVSRGWLGVMLQGVNRDLAESLGLKKPEGALVSKILKDSPASKSDLKVGDVIVEFAGQDIPSVDDLPPLVGSTPANETVKVTVIRNGKKKRLKVTIGELDDAKLQASGGSSAAPKPGKLGLVLKALTDAQRKKLDVENGLRVERVLKGPAANAGVKAGDVIRQLNGTDVESLEQFKAVVDDIEAGSTVAVLVVRGGNPLFIAMRIPQSDDD